MSNQTTTMRAKSSGFGGAAPDMKRVSVQVGRSRTVQWRGKPVSTGIYKQPVAGRVTVHRFNLDGDSKPIWPFTADSIRRSMSIRSSTT
jgi:hypothetical protein